MAAIRSFEELEVWQKATELRKSISKMARTFPEKEKYMLVNQVIRASRSVTNNITEGYGRFHYQENIRFCRQSRGSVYEIVDDLIIARDEEYITKEAFKETSAIIDRVLRLLNGYINYLGKAKKEFTSISKEELAEYGPLHTNE